MKRHALLPKTKWGPWSLHVVPICLVPTTLPRVAQLFTPMSIYAKRSAKDVDGVVECPYCGKLFDAGRCSKSNLNRHLKRYAARPEAERDGHPGKSSAEFKEEARRNRYWKRAESTMELKQRKAQSQRDYLRRRADQRKWRVECALDQLKFDFLP